MSRPDRLLELVHLLGGRRSRTLCEIVDHFRISERTAYRDLASLESRNIPVARDEHGYRLVDGATLRPLGLEPAERALLRLALDNPALNRQPHLARVLRTLRAKLDAVSRPRFGAPSPLELGGPERSGPAATPAVERLEEAASRHRTVRVLYASLSGGGSRRWRTLDPYALVHRDGAWYLVARCHENLEPRLFRLDRVAEARLAGPSFDPPAAFDLVSWLEGAWSVFRGDSEFEVVLHIARDLAPLVRHGHHHDGEEITELDDGAVEYRVTLTHVEEIARWVVGFGGNVTVIEPQELRARVLEIAKGVLGAEEGRRQRPRHPAAEEK